VKFIAWWLDSTVEDVEHARNSLKAEHVISEVLQYFVAGINSRADLFAGISIFSCAGSGLPSIIGRSVVDVWLDQLPFRYWKGLKGSVRLRQARFLLQLSIRITLSV
jgi:hypothetical protein